MNAEISIREATPDDAARISEIYAYYVEHTSITFEYAAPDAAEFRRRIAATLSRYPYLVAQSADGKTVGYAYAGAMKGRRAFDWAAELSVYLDHQERGRGTGKMLYDEITKILKRQNITNLYASITYSDIEDSVHTNASVRFHEREGFAKVAHFHSCGYKFSRWWDLLWMEKVIAPHRAEMPGFIPFPELRGSCS